MSSPHEWPLARSTMDGPETCIHCGVVKQFDIGSGRTTYRMPDKFHSLPIGVFRFTGEPQCKREK